MQTLGKAIRVQRTRLGLSQQELAHRIGVSQAAVGQWERDLAVPRGKRLNSLAQIFGMDPEKLIELTEIPASEPELEELQPQRMLPPTVKAVHEPIHEAAEQRARHTAFSQAFSKELSELLQTFVGSVQTHVRVSGPNKRAWLLDIVADDFCLRLVHPMSYRAALNGHQIASALWSAAVMRASLGTQMKQIVVVRAPETTPGSAVASDNAFARSVVMLYVADAELLGIKLFFVETPEQAAKYIADFLSTSEIDEYPDQ